MNARLRIIILTAIIAIIEGYTISSNEQSSTSSSTSRTHSSTPHLLGSHEANHPAGLNPPLLGSAANKEQTQEPSKARSTRETNPQDFKSASKSQPTTLTLDEVKHQSPAAHAAVEEQRRAERNTQSPPGSRSGLLTGSLYSNSQNTASSSTTNRYDVGSSNNQYQRRVRDIHTSSTTSTSGLLGSNYGPPQSNNQHPGVLQNQYRPARDTSSTSSTTSRSGLLGSLDRSAQNNGHPELQHNQYRPARNAQGSSTTNKPVLLDSNYKNSQRSQKSSDRKVRETETSSTTSTTEKYSGSSSTSTEYSNSYHPAAVGSAESRHVRDTESSSTTSPSSSISSTSFGSTTSRYQHPATYNNQNRQVRDVESPSTTSGSGLLGIFSTSTSSSTHSSVPNEPHPVLYGENHKVRRETDESSTSSTSSTTERSGLLAQKSTSDEDESKEGHRHSRDTSSSTTEEPNASSPRHPALLSAPYIRF